MSRRIYSVPHSGIYAHREHRTKKGRKKNYWIERISRLRKKKEIEKIKIKEIQNEEKEIEY
ncbi:MAG: hypothetical protein PHN89_00495 [Candidatus Pacebacteria bacterium]|nr:hypothetical protein [Candidatus Paceibacterota bacterium]